MAFPYPQGLVPNEVAFLCEMELVTVIPRQRLERLDLLGGPTNTLIPPQRSTLPLWLAVLLKRQKRINILPPPWLEVDNLREILELETQHFQDSFSPPPPLPSVPQRPAHGSRRGGDGGAAGGTTSISARQINYEGLPFYTSTPFAQSCTAQASPTALPYHWFELAELLLDSARDDIVEPDTISGLLRDLREVRLSKMRKGIDVLTGEGDGVRLDGVGAMELSESRRFITGVMDGLRKIGASREQTRREREEEERENGRREYEEDEDEDMT